MSSPKTGSKRKRKSGGAAAAADDDDAEDGPVVAPEPGSGRTERGVKAKAGAAGASAKKKKKKEKKEEKAAGPDRERVVAVEDWPLAFREVERAHRAVNMVYTFLQKRKQVVTTFDTIGSAVQPHIGRELGRGDVAAMVAIRPDGIRFSYVDEVMLQIHVKGAERDTVFKSGRSRDIGAQGPAPDASVGGITGLEELGGPRPDGLGVGGKEVLYVEFVDGDLKRQVVDKKTGEPTAPSRRLRHEELKTPVYSHKQMTNLIRKRDERFRSAVVAFLDRCVEQKTDPELVLAQEAEAHMPVAGQCSAPSGPSGPTERTERMETTVPATIPTERKSIAEIVAELKASPWYTGQIVPDGHRLFAAQEARYGELDFLLSQEMVNALYNAKGISRLFCHQAEAIKALQGGRHVVVSTSTNSGKSMIYNLPVLHALEQDGNSRAMYMFPTKALAQDQKRSLLAMLDYMPGLGEVAVETFDGDTPFGERNQIRDEARIIFTNPDMLHVSILPQHDRWRTFLQCLRYVVVDELHYYNGLMGSHVGYVMRRLRRICAAVGNDHVQFVSCSATVANPSSHFSALMGIEHVVLVDSDGSPSGSKEFVCWNTPYRSPGDPSSGRGSAITECARLFCQLILRGLRVINFCKSRKQCEEMVAATRRELEALGRPECIPLVCSYRGGYTAQDRRRIESDMFQGKLVGIVATSALELGLDMGTLDAVISLGFPYTMANLRQQSGRAGRRNRDSLSVLVGDGFPTDQHYMLHPDELFTKPNCQLQLDLDNVLVADGHLQCAAYELPVEPGEDSRYFGGQALAKMAAERLVRDDQGFYHCHDRFRPMPSRYVSIRETEESTFAIMDISQGGCRLLEEMEASRALFSIYDGAIFLHHGDSYLVRDWQIDKKLAKVEKVRVEWTTQARHFTDIDPVETEAMRNLPGSGCRVYYGTIKIQANVYGYFKMDRKKRILDAVQVDNPPIVRHSKGIWLDVPKHALDILTERRLDVAGAIHAASHAVMSLMPQYVVSMPSDMRTECKTAVTGAGAGAGARHAGGDKDAREKGRPRPARLTLYEARGGSGGSGLTTRLLEVVDGLLAQALERVRLCGCERGCPECVCSDMCRHGNEVMSKAGSAVVLMALLGRRIDVDALPMGPEPDCAPAVGTCVLAGPVPVKGRGRGRGGVEVDGVEVGLDVGLDVGLAVGLEDGGTSAGAGAGAEASG